MGLSVADDDDDDSPLPSPIPQTAMPVPTVCTQNFIPTEDKSHDTIRDCEQLIVKVAGRRVDDAPPEARVKPVKRLFDMDSILAPDGPRIKLDDQAQRVPQIDMTTECTQLISQDENSTEECNERSDVIDIKVNENFVTREVEGGNIDKNGEMSEKNDDQADGCASVHESEENDDNCLVDVESDTYNDSDNPADRENSVEEIGQAIRSERPRIPGLLYYYRDQNVNTSASSLPLNEQNNLHISKYVSKNMFGVQNLQMPMLFGAFRNHYIPVSCIATKSYPYRSVSPGGVVGAESAIHKWRQATNTLTTSVDTDRNGSVTP